MILRLDPRSNLGSGKPRASGDDPVPRHTASTFQA